MRGRLDRGGGVTISPTKSLGSLRNAAIAALARPLRKGSERKEIVMYYRHFALGAVAALAAACGPREPGSPSSSEVAVSVVSGAMNNTSGSSVASVLSPGKPKATFASRVVDALNPEGTAWAADWSCRGGSLSPAFSGPGADPYSYTPVSCSVTWLGGRTASSTWSGPFTLVYGSSCDDTHPFIEAQAAGCTVTRTTGSGGVTRTITGPDGNDYAISHDTNGAGTGWDPSVSPAPANGGVVATCATGGCADGRTLVINGSHLTGDVTIGRSSDKIWDHTVSTAGGGLTITGSGASRVVSGSVTVQHNILKFTATVTFASVGYGEPGCCFPTSGKVSTTIANGADAGKNESLEFSDVCGEATLTTTSGATESLTLTHCL